MDSKQPVAGLDVKSNDVKEEQTCDRCHKSIPLDEMEEHQDFHFASDLQSQEENNSPRPPPVAQAVSQFQALDLSGKPAPPGDGQPPQYAPPSYPPPVNSVNGSSQIRPHTNAVIEAGRVRARDEQQMQNALQNLQFQYRIYNSEIEPEHETDYWCGCPIHQYQRMKWHRYPVQKMWSNAVMYPGK